MNPPPAQRAARGRPSPEMIAACACLGVILLVGVVCSPLLTAGFIDPNDQHYLFGVVDVRSPGWSSVSAAFHRLHYPTGSGPYYQPLVTLSLLLDARQVTDWKAANVQFHLTNFLLHLVNVMLLFAVVRVVGASTLWATLAALLFGLHPVQVESVAWIAQRGTLLATLFSQLAILAYLRFGRTEHFRWFILVTCCYAAAILSEPTFVGLPIALLILDLWPGRRSGWAPILEKMPLLVLLVFCGALQYYLRAHVEPVRAPSLGVLQLFTRNLAGMVGKLVWPAALTPYHPFPSRAEASGLGLWVDVAVLVLVPTVLVWSFRFSRPLFTALAGVVVLVFPGLVNAPLATQMLSDRYIYAALIVPCIAWAAWIKTRGDLLDRAWGRCTALAVAAAAAVFGAQANLQTYCWQDSRELCQHTINLFPQWAGGYVALVDSYVRESDLDSALVYARKAADAAPDDPSTQFYLGRVLLLYEDGRSVEAVAPLRKALASDHDWIDCLHNLGVALMDSGQSEEAVRHLERARDLQPLSTAIRMDLGAAYLMTDQPAAARAEFQVVLNQDNDPRAHIGLARAWAANDMVEQARRHLAAAVAVNPSYATFAARYQVLRRLRDRPGFESLIDLSEHPVDGMDPKRLEALPTRTGPGL